MATEEIRYEEKFIDAGSVQSAIDKALSKVSERYPDAKISNLNANSRHTRIATTGNIQRTDAEVTITLTRTQL